MVEVRSTDVNQLVTGTMLEAREARFSRDYNFALQAGEHMWSVVAQFAVSKKQLEAKGTDEMPLDAENLYGVALGCYICEAPYERRLLNRRCPGEGKFRLSRA